MSSGAYFGAGINFGAMQFNMNGFNYQPQFWRRAY